MFSEDELLPISALQHLLFCERQCALIHVERLWAENRLTVEGRQMHDRAHAGPSESRGGVRIVRGLPLRSLRLGLAGVADVVEFHPGLNPAAGDREPVALTEASSPLGRAPPGTPFPVEYKRGRPKTADCDRVQLCAQALCLEEMLGVAVPAGALFYGRTRRREDVRFDPPLRALTVQAAARLHTLVYGGATPSARLQPKCKNCSLRQLCLPDVTGGSRSAAGYLQRALRQLAVTADQEEPP
jgi:CRISPR-associated exonuclease Cas4